VTDKAWPSLCILLLTYEDGARNTAEITLRSALDNIRYSGDIHVHIADDGSVPGHVDVLRAIAAGYDNVVTVGSTNANRHGYGASYNLASQVVHTAHEIILPLEDDWRLTRLLLLDNLVATLNGGYHIDCIRLGYLGFTQPLQGLVMHTPAGVMMRLDPFSAERHVAAGHPRLETRAFQRGVGPWLEDRPAGATEFEWCGRAAARVNVAWPMDIIQPIGDLFVHIGSHELGELQPG